MRTDCLRVSAMLAALCILAGAALPVFGVPRTAKPTAKRTLTYYVTGKWKTESVAAVKAREARDKKGGHQPWRKDPAYLASVMASNLLPPVPHGETSTQKSFKSHEQPAVAVVTRSWRAEYETIRRRGSHATVTLTIKGMRAYTLKLVCPYGYGWYITRVTPKGAPARSRP